MATGVAFLQSSVDDAAREKSLGKSGSTDGTDVIRQMLREQQRSMGSLHQNQFFREFQSGKKLGKGVPVAEEAPVIDDFQAEGQTRMFNLIKETAIKEEKPLKGVWASFGKPYVCLGDPADPDNRLPALYRDELAGMEGAKSTGKSKSRKSVGPGAGGASASPGTLYTAPVEAPPSTADRQRGSGGKRIGTATSLASMEGTMLPSEVQEFKLNKIKTVLRFGNSDVAEAQFPSGPLRMAAHRRMMSKVKPGSFVSTPGAEAEVSDPYLAYGQPPLPVKHLQPLKGSRRVTHGAAGSERLHGSTTASSTFLTQGLPGSGAGEGSAGSGDEVHHGTTPLQGPGSERYAGEQEGPSDGSDSEEPGIDKQGSSTILPNGMPAPAHARGPGFQPLTVPAVPMRGDEDNPVYTWHNHFVKVRHAGRAALQQALWERAEGRFRARTVGPMAANLSSILMADLDIVRGQQQPYASPGSSPLSPYVKMDASWEALQKRAQVAARAAQQLDPEELRVLQRFYDQLCALVEAQRMSDPLSLMVIHKVKSLLEGGTFLQRTMTVAVVQHLAHFAKSTGIVKYNKFMLSILTFICKCTGVTEAEFEELVKEAGLSQASQGKRCMPELLRSCEPTSLLRLPAPSEAGPADTHYCFNTTTATTPPHARRHARSR